MVKRHLLFAALLAGLLASFPAAGETYAPSTPVGFGICGVLKGANFNSTADQPIPITSPTPNYYLFRITIANASASLSAAVGGIYTAAAKGGLQVIASSQAYSGLTGAAVNTAGSALFLSSVTNTVTQNQATLFLSLTTPQGSAATADIYVLCEPLL